MLKCTEKVEVSDVIWCITSRKSIAVAEGIKLLTGSVTDPMRTCLGALSFATQSYRLRLLNVGPAC